MLFVALHDWIADTRTEDRSFVNGDISRCAMIVPKLLAQAIS